MKKVKRELPVPVCRLGVLSKVAKVASPDAVHQATFSNQRVLRSYRDVDEGDDDGDNDSDDDDDDDDENDDDNKYSNVYEERGKASFDTSRLEKALNNNSKMAKLLKQWHDDGYSVAHVANQLRVNLNGGLDQKYLNLVTSYQAYKRGYRPQ
ncbi:unnamed protein product [Phytophthora lilii]|uniref:RxLR effector protein n=1 Tax=Phytophthora lilii TaxID=2077276 RepID=A0A9W6TK19_9STRA|nr:unnamed protein product [Phytophthora lilii]